MASTNAYDSKGYRQHFKGTNTTDAFDDYEPAYKYGHEAAINPGHKGKDWKSVESSLKQGWESNNGSTWDKFKSSVQHAWDTVTGKA